MINNVKKIEIKEGDNTLKFEIHKMSAVAGERWILRAVSLIGQGFNGGIAANLSSGNIDIGAIVRALCAAHCFSMFTVLLTVKARNNLILTQSPALSRLL